MYQRVNHTSRYQYGELELERKAAMVFHKVCKDQEDSFYKLMGNTSWANPELIGTQVEFTGGRDGNQWDLSPIVLGY